MYLIVPSKGSGCLPNPIASGHTFTMLFGERFANG